MMKRSGVSLDYLADAKVSFSESHPDSLANSCCPGSAGACIIL